MGPAQVASHCLAANQTSSLWPHSHRRRHRQPALHAAIACFPWPSTGSKQPCLWNDRVRFYFPLDHVGAAPGHCPSIHHHRTAPTITWMSLRVTAPYSRRAAWCDHPLIEKYSFCDFCLCVDTNTSPPCRLYQVRSKSLAAFIFSGSGSDTS
jgi:hypothetical protein